MNVIVIKKSKFIGLSFVVKNKNDVADILQKLTIKYKGASHFCYAFSVQNGAQAGMSDDGEPKGTAGKPLFNLIRIKDKNNFMLVVIRFYGGKKLGASTLLRTYINAAKTEI